MPNFMEMDICMFFLLVFPMTIPMLPLPTFQILQRYPLCIHSNWEADPTAFQRAVKGTMRNPPENMRWMKWIPLMFSGIIAKQLVKGKKMVSCELKTLSSIIESENIQKIDLLKIDCEGAEWDVLTGIKEADWLKIKSIVIEVHDTENRVQKVKELFTQKGFTRIIDEQEKGLENSAMYNIFALKV